MAHKRAPNTLVVMKTEGSLIITARVFSNLAKSSQLWPWVHQKWWVAKKRLLAAGTWQYRNSTVCLVVP
jgi:hypothetical protein